MPERDSVVNGTHAMIQEEYKETSKRARRKQTHI